ncbi:MAG: hypothetical protein HKN37_06490, partial [Rhodothermales bacterium]|nr:hypothetical protein [Rhodothermales bacterium]
MKRIWWIGALAAVMMVFAIGLFQTDRPAVASPIEFTDVREETQKFIDYYNSIELTPEQELIKKKALSKIPAPCCSDNSAYTCCCPCNMAKSWWGLSHHLIVNEGFSADEVQAAVEGWIAFIGPKGFTGNACYTGGCVRPFHRNGCGGM